MQIQLDQLINQTLEELKKLGMKKMTIKSYRYSAYCSIKNYCVQHGTTYFEPIILNGFLSFQKKRLESNEISKRHYRKLRRAVLMLEDFSQYGTIQWGYYGNRSTYKTNDYFNLNLGKFLENLHLSKGTIAGIKSNILHFLNHLEDSGHSDFNTLSSKDVKDYISVVAEQYQGSMGNVLHALRLFLGYLKENSLVYMDFNPILNKPAHRKKKVLPCFTHEEVEVILKQIDISTKEGKRDYAILFLVSHTGLRSIDVTNLKLTDIDWANDIIHVIQRKTGQSLSLPLEMNTGNAIAEYILYARPDSDSEYVFLRTSAPYRKLADIRSVSNILEKYRKKAGIVHYAGDGKSFHALRRSMGTWMLESGVPLTTISQVLGHKDQDSAKQYLSMDHERLASCALDFQGIPVVRGLFI